MRFISTKIHAAMDYPGALALIALPILLFQQNGPVVWVPVTIGIMMLLQAMFTNFEYSFANILPMSFHLMMDFLAGVVLAASPWLFGFDDYTWALHLILGLGLIGASLTTKLNREVPSRSDFAATGAQRAV